MLKRYIGPHESVEVRIAGNDFGVVEQGGQLAVPDDLAESVAWSEELWEDAKEAPARQARTPAPASTKKKDDA